MQNSEIAHWLMLNAIFKNSPQKVTAWFNRHGSINNLFTAAKDELLGGGISLEQAALLKTPHWGLLENELKWLEQDLHHCILFTSADYPPLLREIADPPILLYAQGNIACLMQPQIAIVGSRSATPQGKYIAESFAAALAEGGMVITSGLARGIDAAAHRGALNSKRATIAVAGTGLAHVYPAQHKQLAKEIILNNGLLLSEFCLDQGPRPYNFPRRNRVIAGLAKGVLIVEAALRSGSLITIRHALDQGRDVFAIPGSIQNPLAKGCNFLIQQGAKLCQTPQDILEEYSLKNNVNQIVNLKKPPALEPLTKAERAILHQIDSEITPIDMIIFRSQLAASEVSSILLILELKGYIQCTIGGYFRVLAAG